MEGKKVGIMGGCYCPPHAGHYNSIVNAIRELSLDIVIIQIFGRENKEQSRHGTPSTFSMEILD